VITKWYQAEAKEIAEQLSVHPEEGLSDGEASKRQNEYGRNELHASKRINPFALFFNQFKDALIIILLIAASVSFALAFVEEGGSIKESLLIMTIVFAIALVGFFNEFKAEKTVEALKK